MARGRKFKRGLARKPQAEATQLKAVEESEVKSKETVKEVETPDCAPEAPVLEKNEATEDTAVSAEEAKDRSKTEKGTDSNDIPNTENRRKSRGRKGKKLDEANGSPKEKSLDFSGLIFMCNSDTKKDCFKYKVFGFPEARKNVVEQVKKGTKLFLFDIDKRILHGVYKAASEGGMNLVEEAFNGSNGKFPAQVLFSIQKDCQPLDESVFKHAIKENYFRGKKFKCELSYEQVGRLMKLFRPLDAKGPPEAKRGMDVERNSSSKNRTPRGPRMQGGREPPLSKFSGPASRKEGKYTEYPPAHSRKRFPGEGMARAQPRYPLVPEAAYVEQDLTRQMHLRQLQDAHLDTMYPRSYLPDPITEAAFARKRYLEDVYAAEQQGVLPKRPLLSETLYREPEYRRELAYQPYGDNLQSLSGAFHYDQRSANPAWL